MSNSNSILSQKSILSSLHQICNPISNWESFWMSNPYCHPKWIPLKLYLYSKVKFQVKSNLTFSLRFSSKSNLISNPLSNIILKFQLEIRCLILISIWNHCLTKAKVKLKLTFARPLSQKTNKIDLEECNISHCQCSSYFFYFASYPPSSVGIISQDLQCD